jgi:hypothetical protein
MIPIGYTRQEGIFRAFDMSAKFVETGDKLCVNWSRLKREAID